MKNREKWVRWQSCPPHKGKGRQQVKVMQRQKCKPSRSFPHPQEDTPTFQRTPTGSSSQVVSYCGKAGSKMDPREAFQITTQIDHIYPTSTGLCCPITPQISQCSLDLFPATLSPISSFFQRLQLAISSAHSPPSHVLLVLPGAPSLCQFMGHSSQSTTGVRC